MPNAAASAIQAMNQSATPSSPAGTPAAPFLRVEKNGDVLVDVHVVPNAAKHSRWACMASPALWRYACGCTRRRWMARQTRR